MFEYLIFCSVYTLHFVSFRMHVVLTHFAVQVLIPSFVLHSIHVNTKGKLTAHNTAISRIGEVFKLPNIIDNEKCFIRDVFIRYIMG